MNNIPKPDLSKWQNRVKEVAKYHYANVEENPKWRLEDTARELDRSKGRISEDLMLAVAMLEDPYVAKCKTAQEALDYIRNQKKEAKQKKFESIANHNHEHQVKRRANK